MYLIDNKFNFKFQFLSEKIKTPKDEEASVENFPKIP